MIEYYGAQIKANYKHIYFEMEPLKEGKKTTFFFIRSNNTLGSLLGSICWHGHWRQYVMETLDNMIFNNQCLRDIAEFIDNINRPHK